MSDQLESIKDTIRDHPAETIAVVATVGLIGTIFYYRTKEKKAAAKETVYIQPKIGWFSRYLEYRTARAQLKLVA